MPTRRTKPALEKISKGWGGGEEHNIARKGSRRNAAVPGNRRCMSCEFTIGRSETFRTSIACSWPGLIHERRIAGNNRWPGPAYGHYGPGQAGLANRPSGVTNSHVSPARAGGACAIPPCSPPVRSSDGPVVVAVRRHRVGTGCRPSRAAFRPGVVSDPIQAHSAGCGCARRPLAAYGLLVCWQGPARSSIASRPARVQPMPSESALATRTPLRWFAAPAVVQGSTERQTPGGRAVT